MCQLVALNVRWKISNASRQRYEGLFYFAYTPGGRYGCLLEKLKPLVARRFGVNHEADPREGAISLSRGRG